MRKDCPELNLRISPLLIPLAHTLVAFSFVVRSLLMIVCAAGFLAIERFRYGEVGEF